MVDEAEFERLSEVEIALIDAMKTILEVILFVHPESRKYLDQAYGNQRDTKLQSRQPGGAAVLELLRLFVVDPERQEAREQLAKFLSAEPRGQA